MGILGVSTRDERGVPMAFSGMVATLYVRGGAGFLKRKSERLPNPRGRCRHALGEDRAELSFIEVAGLGLFSQRPRVVDSVGRVYTLFIVVRDCCGIEPGLYARRSAAQHTFLSKFNTSARRAESVL